MSPDEERAALDESARWIAAHVPARVFESAVVFLNACLLNDVQGFFGYALAYADELSRVIPLSREAAQRGGPAWDAWEKDALALSEEHRAGVAEMHRRFRTMAHPLLAIARAYGDLERSGEALAAEFLEPVSVSLHAVLASALSTLRGTGVPAMPEGLSPEVMVRASPAALRSYLVCTLERRRRRDTPVTLAYREHEGRALLTIHQPGRPEGLRSGPNVFVEETVLAQLAIAAGALDRFPGAGEIETTVLAFEQG